jgi:hypothetical protein
MRRMIWSVLLGFWLLPLSARTGRAGLVEGLPLLEPGVTAYQISSHNKKGLNGDGGWFLHPAQPDPGKPGVRRAVLFEAHGPGSIRAIWGLGEHDIHIEADGKVIVDAAQEDYFGGRVSGFPLPLVRQTPVASGPWKCVAHWSFVPIGYMDHCVITTDHTEPFYHVIAERYRDPARAVPFHPNQDLSAFNGLWSVAAQDPKDWRDLLTISGMIDLAPGAFTNILNLVGEGTIASLRFTLPEGADANSLRLRMAWDGGTNDVDAPVGFFFGAGVRWQDIPSVCFGIHGREGYCYWPMPFWSGARMEVENRGPASVRGLGYRIDWRREPYAASRAGYFRTCYHEGNTTRGRDWSFLERRGQGHFVGVVQRLIGGHYCEGDIRFYVDGSRSPAFYGTGTEDYYHQACWPNMNNHTPFHGCVGDVAEQAKEAGGGRTFYDFPACYYRVHLEAPVRFRSSIRCGIEHGGTNDTDSVYASLAFYYGRDQLGLVETDAVAFEGPGAETIESYFEGDDDDVPARCVLLKSSEPVTRTLKIDPANSGVRLRRTLDQSLGPQQAQVLVDGVLAGNWSDPDSNPWKRLAESDFELRPDLVRGKASVRVQMRPVGGAWSMGELRALCHTGFLTW